jgi:hypothetical protein
MLPRFIVTLHALVYLLLSGVHAAPVSLLERDGISILSADQVGVTLLSLCSVFH